MIRLLLLNAIAFCLVEASGYGSVLSHNGLESEVNKVNALRQLAVNRIAQRVGSGTGTASRDGVAGTPLGRSGHSRYGQGHGSVYAKGYGNGYGYSGYSASHDSTSKHTASHNGYEAEVNRNNAIRQLQVNSVAEHVGSGTGTARKDGVPGTPFGRTGHDRYSKNGRYGNGGRSSVRYYTSDGAALKGRREAETAEEEEARWQPQWRQKA